jgi:hypothetical protein
MQRTERIQLRGGRRVLDTGPKNVTFSMSQDRSSCVNLTLFSITIVLKLTENVRSDD